MVKIKKTFCLLLCIIVVIAVCPMCFIASAETGTTQDGFVYNIANAKACHITGYTGSGVNISVPAEIEGIPVTAIQVMAFMGNDKIETVALPATCAYICQKAFMNCTALKAIVIPAATTELQDSAFEGCTKLTDVTINIGLKTIGKRVFAKCSSLKHITLPEGVKVINNMAFEECTSLETIDLPSTLTTLGNAVFNKCTSFKSTTLPDGLTSIGDYAFNLVPSTAVVTVNTLALAKRLKEINFPGIIEGAPIEDPNDYDYSIQEDVAVIIKYNGSDKSISVPVEFEGNPTKKIDENAFKDCTTLERVYLPVPIIEVADNSFEGCSALNLISFPENFAVIGKEAFKNCINLKILTIPSTVTAIGKDAFKGIASDSVISVSTEAVKALVVASGYTGEIAFVPENDPRDYTFLTTGAALVKSYNGSKSKIFIPDRSEEDLVVVAIVSNAFAGKTDLAEVGIPDSITYIGSRAFSNCSNINKIILPSKLQTIESKTFEGCVKLSNINMPESLKEIDDYAFLNCHSITAIAIPNGVERLGIGVFQNAQQLKSIMIPETVTEIGENCFNGIAGDAVITVNSLKMKELVRKSGAKCTIKVTGYGVEDLTDYSINSETIKGNGTNGAYNGSSKEIIVPSSIGSDKAVVFPGNIISKNTVVTRVVLNEGYKELEDKAFYQCTSLKEIVLPSTIIKIGNDVFGQLPADCEIHVPNKKVYDLVVGAGFSGTIKGFKIADEDDYKYKVLDEKTAEAEITEYIGNQTEILLPENVTISGKEYTVASIGDNAFSGTSISEVEMPDSILRIGNGAFKNCTSLISVKLSSKITKIPNSLFSGCTNLKDVNLGDDIVIIEANSFTSCGIEDIKLPKYLFEIGDNAFSGCNNLKNIEIPETVNKIGTSAFANCSVLEITVNDGTSEDYVKKSGFTGSIIGGTITNLSDYKFSYFQNNTKAKIMSYTGTDESISIPAYTSEGIPVCSINNNAFANNYTLKKVIMPDTVYEVGNNAFDQCVNIEYLKLSKNLTSIGGRSFQFLVSLKELEIPEGITNISSYSFRFNFLVRNLVIPNGVKNIEAGAFYYCTGLRTVQISDSVEGIANIAFDTFSERTVGYCSEKISNLLAAASSTLKTVNEAYQTESLISPTHIKFTSTEAVSRLYTKSGDDTEITFDSKENAAKIAVKDVDSDKIIKNPATFYMYSSGQSAVYDSSISTESYPYMVMTVKTGKNPLSHDGAEWVTSYSREICGKDIHPGRGSETFIKTNVSEYQNQSDWQTVVISDVDSEFIKGNWVSIGLKAVSAADADIGDYILVKEIQLLTEKEYEDFFSGSKVGGATLIDFTLEDNFEKAEWSDLVDTYAEYDTKLRALMVSAKDAASGSYADGALTQQTANFSVTFKDVAVEEYPILAIRLKLKNTSVSAGWFGFKTTNTIKEDANLFYDIMKPIYTATDDWQTVIIDCSQNNAMGHMFNGNWIAATFNLTFTASATAEDIFHVEWAGIFKTVEEAINASDANILTKEPVADEETAVPDVNLNDLDINASFDSSDDETKEPERKSKKVAKTYKVTIPGTDYTLIIVISVVAVVAVAVGIVFLILYKKKHKKLKQ